MSLRILTRCGESPGGRAAYAGYRLITADAHVTRAQLAVIANDVDEASKRCRLAIDICDLPDCGYAWAKQDAQAILNDLA